MNTISTLELVAAMESQTPPMIFHVMSEESWEIQRIPGSYNVCVYEMDFLNKAVALCPGAETSIVVYGLDQTTQESSDAAAKLIEAGYLNVANYREGLAGWMQENLSVVGTGQAPAEPPLEGVWQIDVSDSIIRWTGRNLFNYHHGSVRIGRGYFQITGETLSQSSFVIDMRSIVCDDMPDQATNQLLLEHLASIDFFSTELFPEANFSATSVLAIRDAAIGSPNYKVIGDLTLRDMIHPISFPAVIAINDQGRLVAQTQIEIDRTCWGVNYGSGRLYSWLGKHVVNDMITLHIKISATRQA